MPDFKTNRGAWVKALLVLLAVLFISAPSISQAGTLDDILALYKPMQSTWYNAIHVYAERLFWMLVSIDVAWWAILLVLEKSDEFKSIQVSLIKKVLSICFFWAVLKFADTWVPAIISSLSQIGTTVSGTSATPDGILVDGIETALTIIGVTKDKSMYEQIFYGLFMAPACMIILLAYFFAAITLLTTLIETYLVTGAGAIMLGLGGSRWTTEFTSKYLQYAFTTGLKLMVIYLIVGIGKNIGAHIVIDSTDSNLIESVIKAMFQALTFAFLVGKSGSIAAAMMSGSPQTNGNEAVGFGLGVAAGGAGLLGGLGGAAKGLGAAGMGAGFAAAGAAQAVGAGMQVAQEAGLSGLKGAAAGFGHAGAAMAREIVGSFGGGVKESMAAKIDNTAGARAAMELLGGLGDGMVPVTQSAAGADSGAPASGSETASADSGSSPSGSSSSAGDTIGGSSSPAGNAKTASVQPDNGSGNSSGGGQERKTPLHQRTKNALHEAKGFMPEDGNGGTVNIPMNHIE